MDAVTTWLELAGALAVIAGIAVLALPVVGAGWVCVLVGVLLVGLSALVTWRNGAPASAPVGRETA